MFTFIVKFVALVAVFSKAFAAEEVRIVAPQMGWNSWNKFACNISESLIKETADALVSTGLKDLGYVYMNLDDCWQAASRGADGKIEADPTRFPSGLKSLGEYIHSKGLKFGIYSSAGFKTCQAFPASLGLEEIDAASYAEWEVDYLKYDNCYEDHGVPQSRYGAMGKALKASGRDIFYSLCEWGRENPAVWGPSVGAQSWRISGDIRDDWSSISSRAEIAASLWRYSGPGKGWNDPDMLEIGNGKCTDDEYKTHFGLWAMLKAPLIIGNDIRILGKDSLPLQIYSNKEILAVSQDPRGGQGRITYSDTTTILEKLNFGDRLIATKCATGVTGEYEDSPMDQQWSYQTDGTIKSTSTGRCLMEQEPFKELSHLDHFNFTLGLRAVITAECSVATKWDQNRFIGGSIVSRTTGLCLEVAKMEYIPIIQGKRIQTAPCQTPDVLNRKYWDVREHQSWTAPNGALLNLYQRQCLTVDRDAFPGLTEEVWAAPMADGSTAVLLVNKGEMTKTMQLTLDMIGLDSTKTYHMRDLWTHTDLVQPLSVDAKRTFVVKSHASVMLKVTAV